MKSNLTKRIANERLKLNETVAKNNSLKKEVDMLRKELKSSHESTTGLRRNISKAKERALGSNRSYVAGKRKTEEANNHILALQAKHEQEKERFETQIRQLQERL